MIRINLSYIFKIREGLLPLIKLEGEKSFDDIFLDLISGFQILRSIFDGEVYRFITCQQSANRLYSLLEKVTQNKESNIGIDTWQIAELAKAAQAFDMALSDELGTMPSYLVSPKGGYDVNVLISNPEALFPIDLAKLVPETKYDIEQAAKCLAFEVPTAAGFHLHRINESVLQRYWEIVTNGATHPKQRNMGVYLTELKRRRKGEAKVKTTLQQIKDLHRNPILHPEQSLTLQDAIELLGIIVSVVSKMLTTIKKESPMNQDSNSFQLELNSRSK